MLPASLVARFPKLSRDGAFKTSDATGQYNCIAWSAERDQARWWQPEIIEPWDHWPDGVSDDCSFECFVSLFEKQKYKGCELSNTRLEVFYEKIALYADANGDFTHVASQLASGVWTSKLGPYEDISHNSLECLAGSAMDEYGEVRQIMRRGCGFFGMLQRIFFKVVNLAKR